MSATIKLDAPFSHSLVDDAADPQVGRPLPRVEWPAQGGRAGALCRGAFP